MLFTAFSPTNKAFLSSPSLLLTSHDMLSTPLPLPSAPLHPFHNCQNSQIHYETINSSNIYKSLQPPLSWFIPVWQFSPSLTPSLVSGLLAQALGSFEVALFIQPAWDAVVCGDGEGWEAFVKVDQMSRLYKCWGQIMLFNQIFWALHIQMMTDDY